jgi:4,5-DOPA dioxygenase extradiol
LSTAHGGIAHPTPDHWLPLLYAAGAGGDDDVSYPVVGFDLGSLSMRSVRFG